MSGKRCFDVIVVGAGPSGSTASYILAREGLKVALMDKARLPRQKVCGGGLTSKTVTLLKELGLLDGKVLMNACKTLSVFYKGRRLFDIDDVRLFITLRDVFDYSLAKRAVEAGATLFENTCITGIKEVNGNCKVVTRDGDIFSAKAVIGADGVYSTVAKALGRKWEKKDLSIATAALLRLGKNEDFDGNVCEVHFGITRNGYCWVFPVSNAKRVFNVGCGITLNYSRSLLPSFHYFVTKRFNYNYTSSVRAHLLPTPSKLNREFFGRGRILLVGDAAGLVDPWFGEGIYYAIRSAFYASQAILTEDNSIFSTYYYSLVKHILPDLKCAYLYGRIFYSRIGMMLKIIKGSKRLTQGFIKLLEGEIRHRDLLKYLICVSKFLRRS